MAVDEVFVSDAVGEIFIADDVLLDEETVVLFSRVDVSVDGRFSLLSDLAAWHALQTDTSEGLDTQHVSHLHEFGFTNIAAIRGGLATEFTGNALDELVSAFEVCFPFCCFGKSHALHLLTSGG